MIELPSYDYLQGTSFSIIVPVTNADGTRRNWGAIYGTTTPGTQINNPVLGSIKFSVEALQNATINSHDYVPGAAALTAINNAPITNVWLSLNADGINAVATVAEGTWGLSAFDDAGNTLGPMSYILKIVEAKIVSGVYIESAQPYCYLNVLAPPI